MPANDALRLRPIIMTSFAFILGCVPLWFASGSGAVARRVMGTTVIGGMVAATLIAIFLIPVTYYVVERFAANRRQRVPQGVAAARAAPRWASHRLRLPETGVSATDRASTSNRQRPV